MHENSILYDDQCKLCTSIKKQIENKDIASKFNFIDQNSDTGRKYIQTLQLNKKEQNSIIYITDKNSYLARSNAVLEILKILGRYNTIYFLIKLFPKRLRDLGYNIVAWLRRFI